MHVTLQPCQAIVTTQTTRQRSQAASSVHPVTKPSFTSTSSRTCFGRRQPNNRRHTSLKANDRTAAPPADTMSQPTSPDHAAVIEHSEQFLVHLKAAIMDPKLQKKNEVNDEIKGLVEQLKSVQPKDRKKLTKDGISGTFRPVVSDIDRMSPDGITTLGTMSFQQFKPTEWKVKAEVSTMDIGQASATQYQVNIPITFQEGPLEGMQAIQSTIGEYSLDDNEPSKQNIAFTKVVLRPGSTDSSSLEKWKDVMKKENESMDDKGEIVWTAPQPMKGFRDFLYHDDQLQVSIGNRGSLTIMQK